MNKYSNDQIFNLDMLTYVGNLENLKDVKNAKKNCTFLKVDINDTEEINQLFANFKFDKVIHLASESHLDRSITTVALQKDNSLFMM